MTCNGEAPSVEEAKQRWAGKVDIVGMAWQGSDDDMQSFVDRHGISFANVNDDAGELFARFGVPSQPAWAFIDRKGELCVGLGAIEPAELDDVFGKLEADTFGC